MAKKITGKKIPVVIGPRRHGDPPRLVGDAARIRNELNWLPEYDDLETILETAWKWHVK